MAEIKRPSFRKSKTKKKLLIADIIGILFSILGLWVLMILMPLFNKFIGVAEVFIERKLQVEIEHFSNQAELYNFYAA